MNKAIIFLFFSCTTHFCFSQLLSKNTFINPTGTYILKGENQKGEIVGNFAEIRIKLLSDSLLAFTMYCNKGFPDYTSGALIDTVAYIHNSAMYASKLDASCQLQFAFEPDRLHIKIIYTDPASNCGFERGVLPLGFIEKSSSSIPIIQPIIRPQ